jgi:dihydroorotase
VDGEAQITEAKNEKRIEIRVKNIVTALAVVASIAVTPIVGAAQTYDLLLQGGHLIDPRNDISGVRDVAIAAGKIAAVASKIDAAGIAKVIDARGLIVTPGLVDIHTHVYAGTGEKGSYAGDNSVYPDLPALRSGVTTVVDAGGSGWRNFEDFKQRIIDRAKTRVLAFLNIVGHGMRGGKFEQDLQDMAAQPTADMARRYPGIIIGIKTAHYSGPEWAPVERAVEAGTLTMLPVMVDFGSRKPERPLSELVTSKLRAGDIYTHMYSGLRGEQDPSGKVNAALWEGRKRGVLFDVGHGGTSFAWRIAVPAVKEGFLPDVISTDMHVASMSGGMKDLPNVMSKFLALGMPLEDVVRRTTWNAARAIRQDALGHVSVGADADVAVWRIEKGTFGFIDGQGTRLNGSQRIAAELTLRGGRVVYDLNGLAAVGWKK